jgi:uncharacterized protein (DUF2236 family)
MPTPPAIPSQGRSTALATEVGGAPLRAEDGASPLGALGGLPLGPGSLTWRYLGDARNVLLAGRAGILQTMHPAIDAGVREHSDFFVNPLNRIIRSAGPILGVVYDQDWRATGQTVRDFHRPIKGTMRDGSRYAALDPDTYYWAHATFFEAQIATQELFGTPLSGAEKERLYAESITWYKRYGLSMRPVPRDYSAFERYWQSMFEDVLVATPIALGAVRTTRKLPAPHPAIDGPAWAAVRPLIGFGAPWLTRGTLPAQAQAILDVNWSRGDELALSGLRRLIRTAWPIVPARFSRLPRASR